jgi:hypothetical protein
MAVMRAATLGAITLGASFLTRAVAGPAAAPAVDIAFALDASKRLTVRYRAPESVARLDFLLAADRVDRDVRGPMMKPADDCGALVPQGIALRHGPGCADGALFVVQPRVLAMDAMNEPAQPTSDGGVLFYTGYYVAMAPGLPVRLRFRPAAGDYGVDDGRKHEGDWQVEPGLAFEGGGTPADPRHSDDWLARQHAQHYIFLGHSPVHDADGLLWIRDPAVPQGIADTVGRAGPLAWDAYARASGVVPAGPAAIVMLAALTTDGGAPRAGFHGDRTEGRMLRLSFFDPPAAPSPAQVEEWSKFVAHETAHLWNHGVFGSDQARPWIHEGDAEWVALNAMHDAGLFSDPAYAGVLEGDVNACLLVRGDAVAATLPPGRTRKDDPYACGVALQFLGWAMRHARPEAKGETVVAAWGALHRAHPQLDAAGFAQFFDAKGAHAMGDLLLGERTPFASTYRADLAAVAPVTASTSEPDALDARIGTAVVVIKALLRQDCGAAGFGISTGQGEVALDPDLKCRALPAGARFTTIAGQPVFEHPRAAWLAVRRACADGAPVKLGLVGGASVDVACPTELPELPPRLVMSADLLQRLELLPHPSTKTAASPPTSALR